MSLSKDDVAFLEDHHDAAMITVGADGKPKVARVVVTLVDGALWSSGTQDRVRTRRLRQDPRCTLFVFDTAFAWLALEATVTIHDGADAPERNVRHMRQSQGKPTGPLSWFGRELDETDFLQLMADEQRLIYEFDVHHSYGLR